MTNHENHPRREFLKLTGAIASLGILAIAMPAPARAEDLAHLSESDATATALGYKEDASKVDAAKYSTHKAGQQCVNCKLFSGTEKTPWAGCPLFPSRAVSGKGWCSAYSAKA